LPSVTCWGSGTPFREFLYADDLGSACVFLMENYSEELFINVGSGKEITIRQLTELVAKVIGYQGEILWDTTKPDGAPRKLMDGSRLFALGWQPTIGMVEGVGLAYQDYLKKLAAK
ncbi:MAG: GDP-L-fucose synthase, partial [Verrucomicrobia bacterium]|nr:GDP-L-fucose synthase [Verrucomicrobiota bacterium]